MNNDNDRNLISVILPVYNEEYNIVPMLNRLLDMSRKEPKYEWEFIFVDDGSRDGTAERIIAEHEKDNRVKLLALTRNFGHQIALTAGLIEAKGEAVISLDGDGQHPPEVIPDFLRAWESKKKVVLGVRQSSEASTVKQWTSTLFYRILNKLTNIPIHPQAADFRLMDRIAVDRFVQLPERARFIRGMVNWLGYDTGIVRYREPSRTTGKSKYSLIRMCLFALDAITSFSATPLRLATFLGFIVTLFACAFMLYALVVRLFVPHGTVSGWTSVILMVLFLGGIQLICLGLIGEYLYRVFEEVKQRPLYVVKNRLGL